MYESDGNFYNDEYEAKREQYLNHQADVMGNKLMRMFKLTIFSIIASVVATVVLFAVGIYAGFTGGSVRSVIILAYGIVIGGFIIQGIYSLIMMSLKEFDDRYQTAGLLNFFGALCNLLKEFISETSLTWLASLCSFASSILLLISLLIFVDAITEDVAPFNSYLSGSWEGFKKAYIAMVAITVIGILIALLVPLLGVLVLSISSLAGIVIGVWQIVLLYKTGKTMLQYKEGY